MTERIDSPIDLTIVAAVAAGLVYRRSGEGDYLYLPSDSIDVTEKLSELRRAGFASLGGSSWSLTPAGRRWLGECVADALGQS